MPAINLFTAYPVLFTVVDGISQSLPSPRPICTFTSSDATKASVNATTGSLTLMDTGSTTITCAPQSPPPPTGFAYENGLGATLALTIRGCGDGEINAGEECEFSSYAAISCMSVPEAPVQSGSTTGCNPATCLYTGCGRVGPGGPMPITSIAFGPSVSLSATVGVNKTWSSGDLGGLFTASYVGGSVTFAPDRCHYSVNQGQISPVDPTLTDTALTYLPPATSTGPAQLTCTISSGTIDIHSISSPVSNSIPISLCGNGIPETPEACDDGNNDSGDGCSPTCQTEDITVASIYFDAPTPLTTPPSIRVPYGSAADLPALKARLSNGITITAAKSLCTFAYTGSTGSPLRSTARRHYRCRPAG